MLCRIRRVDRAKATADSDTAAARPPTPLSRLSGAISGNRGSVRRVAEGVYQAVFAAADQDP